jgi:hypothetical protein
MRIKSRNLYSEADGRWAGSRETNLDSGRSRTFFLTSLFIELIEVLSVIYGNVAETTLSGSAFCRAVPSTLNFWTPQGVRDTFMGEM